MSGAPNSGVMPIAVRLRTGSRVLELEWSDAAHSSFTHAELRRSCKCATCEQLRRSGQTPIVCDDVSITAVNAVGAGALQFHFSDGHAHGIFPFAYLRQLGATRREPAGV